MERLNSQLAGSPYLFPESAEGDEAAKALARRLQNVGRRVRRLHEKLAAEQDRLLSQIPDEMAVRRVYESNALEGLGLPLEDTFRVVMERRERTVEQILREKGIREGLQEEPKIQEVAGLDDAYKFADEISAGGRAYVGEIDLRNLQGLITTGEPHAGAYKQEEVQIAGSEHTPVSVTDTPFRVREMLEWLNQGEVAPVLKACVAHAWLTHIHPFKDGNGRTARVLANIMLAAEGHPPLIIRSQEDKGQYLLALAASDRAGNLLQFADLFTKAINRGVYELEQPEVRARMLRADLYGSELPGYLAWQQQLAMFTEQVCTGLRVQGIGATVVGGLSPSGFQMLADSNEGGNGWYLRVRRPASRLNLLLWFGFPSREYRDVMGSDERFPAIFFSERDRAPLAHHPYKPLIRSGRLAVNEVVLRPGYRHPVALRSGLDVNETTVKSAVAAVVESIATYEARYLLHHG